MTQGTFAIELLLHRHGDIFRLQKRGVDDLSIRSVCHGPRIGADLKELINLNVRALDNDGMVAACDDGEVGLRRIWTPNVRILVKRYSVLAGETLFKPLPYCLRGDITRESRKCRDEVHVAQDCINITPLVSSRKAM